VAEEPEKKETKGQNLTLSLRISETLRNRLEAIRDLLSRRKGEPVTTSEVAKQLLEAAGEEHLEEVTLYSNPTESLQSIRKKASKNRALSRAEWELLAYYVQLGTENGTKTPISPESFASIMEAFLSLFAKCVKSPNLNRYYLGNLPSECHPSDAPETEETVRAATTETIKRVLASPQNFTPRFVARNLYVLLDQGKFAGAMVVNEALLPYWPVLWRVAARGHYLTKKEPIRDESKELEHLYGSSFPPLSEGPAEMRYGLSVTVGENSEMHLLLSFPGSHGPMYPIGPYPKIAEFRAMLASLKPRQQEVRGRQLDAGFWNGEKFFGYVTTEGEAAGYWFRAYENGITLGFTNEGWRLVQELFRKVWANPELNAVWEKLGQDYGEL
jgi:hypothetical protein